MSDGPPQDGETTKRATIAEAHRGYRQLRTASIKDTPFEWSIMVCSQIAEAHSHKGNDHSCGHVDGDRVAELARATFGLFEIAFDRIDEQQATIDELEDEIDEQQATIDELEDEIEESDGQVVEEDESEATVHMRGHGTAVSDIVVEYEGREFAVGNQIDQTRNDVDDLEDRLEASDDAPDQNDEAINVDEPGGEAASSALDFYANCWTPNVKESFCVGRNRQNTYRAIQAAKHWDDFAQVSNDGDRVLWTRQTLKHALTAVMGENPHEQTVSRVWKTLKKLGQDDIVEKRRRVSNKKGSEDVLKLSRDTAEGLLDRRYVDDRPLSDGIAAITDVVGGPTAVGV